MEKLKKISVQFLGMIIGEIAKIYEEIVENSEKILEEFTKIFKMWKTYDEILKQLLYFRKIWRNFKVMWVLVKFRRNFSINFGKSSRCEGSSGKY